MTAMLHGLARASLLAIAVLSSAPARAGTYPSGPVSIITPAPAGTGPDVIARIVAEQLTRIWKQQVLILNRPGAGGLVGARAAVAANADGYTLYMPLSSTFVVLPLTQSKLPFDLNRDVVPIGMIGEQPMVITVNPKLGVSTLAELITLTNKRPDEILFGAGVGSLPNLTGELLRTRTGAKLRFVPYPNTAHAMQDAVNGTTSVYIESLSGLSGLIQSGTLKALAVASARRLSNLPNVPTVAEAVSGLGVFEARGWFAMMAPAGTPYDIVRKVNRDLREALGNSELKSQFEKLGTYPLPMSPDETAKFIHDEQQLWAPIVEKVGISKH